MVVKQLLQRFQETRLVWLGVLFGVGFYVTHVYVEVSVFGHGTFLGQFFSPDLFSLWVRGSVLVLATGFGVYAHSMLRRVRATEKSLDSIVANIPDMVLVKDAKDLRFRRLNRAGERLLGYSDEELRGRSDFDILPRHRAKISRAKDYEVLQGGTVVNIPGEEVETRYHGRRLLHTRKVPILDEKGKPQYLLEISSDITERQVAEAELMAEKERTERYLQISESVILELDVGGCIDLINRRGCELLDYDAEELLGRDWFTTCVPGEKRETVRGVFRQLISGALTDTEHYENEVVTRTGKRRFMFWHNVVRRDAAGNIIGTLSSGQDITRRRQAEEVQRLAAAVLESTSQAVVITDGDCRIVSVNPAYTAITGYLQLEVIGREPSFRTSGHHDEAFFGEIRQALERYGHWKGEVWDRRKDGEAFPTWQTISAITDSEGEISNYVAVFSDITPIKQHQADLDFLAHHDPLTGLPNRLMFDDRLAHALERRDRERSDIVLLFIDLNGFKKINDEMGHPAGDRLLRVIGRRLQKLLRAEDTVARFGGDEFVILMEAYSSQGDMVRVLERIETEISRPVEVGPKSVSVGGSIGVARGPRDGRDGRTLLRAADVAMYRAKTDPARTWCFYEPDGPGG